MGNFIKWWHLIQNTFISSRYGVAIFTGINKWKLSINAIKKDSGKVKRNRKNVLKCNFWKWKIFKSFSFSSILCSTKSSCKPDFNILFKVYFFQNDDENIIFHLLRKRNLERKSLNLIATQKVNLISQIKIQRTNLISQIFFFPVSQ